MKPTIEKFEVYVSRAPKYMDPVDLFWDWIIDFDLSPDDEQQAYENIFRKSSVSDEGLPF